MSPDPGRVGLKTLLTGFDPATEAVFTDEHNVKGRHYVRLLAVLGTALYLAFGLADGGIAAADIAALDRVRFGIILPGFSVMLALTFFRFAWKVYQPLTAVMLLLVQGGAHFVFTMTSLHHVTHNMITGNLLVILMLYTAPRLYFPWALFAGFGFTVMQLVAMAASPLVTDHGPDGPVFMVGANLIGILIAQQLERDRRQDFLLRRALAHAQAAAAVRNAIMERFLAEHVRSRFAADLSLEENLDRFLVPRPARVALLQADIRGFTRLAAELPPIEVVALLQRYYRRLVDAAQKVGQVKVVGDALFVFVEATPGQGDAGLARTIVGLAELLVAETTALNAGAAPGPGSGGLNFGIAVHLGDAIVGNLSSESCIDYTVVGTEVNKVARLEELTKQPVVARTIGLNGILMSEAVAQALDWPDCRGQFLELAACGLSLRSFPEVRRIHYLTASPRLVAKAG